MRELKELKGYAKDRVDDMIERAYNLGYENARKETKNKLLIDLKNKIWDLYKPYATENIERIKIFSIIKKLGNNK